MAKPGYHWPNAVQLKPDSRDRFIAGHFNAGVILSNTPVADALWLLTHAPALGIIRLFEPAGDLAAPADVAARHVPYLQSIDDGAYVQLLNEPDREYPSKSPEQFAAWWDICAGYLLEVLPRLRLGFPAPSILANDDYLPRIATAGGLRRASFIGERGYWQDPRDTTNPTLGYRWQRSLPYRIPIIITEFGNSDPTTPKADKARQYVDYCANLPRSVLPAGVFIGAGGDPHWDSPQGGAMWIDDAMAQIISSHQGERSMDPSIVARVLTNATLIQKYAQANNLPPSLVAGLIAVESGGQPDATSPDNGPGIGHALGLMQVLEGNFAAGENGHDPETNIRVGTAMLGSKVKGYGGRLASGLAAYFGAVDGNGNPTSGADLTGTTGIQYVSDVEAAAQSFTQLDTVPNPAPGPIIQNPAPAPADPDFASYAPKTGTWREAAINLKGVADDALATGRKMVAEVAASWANR